MQGALEAVIGELAEQIKAPALTQEQIEKDGPMAKPSQITSTGKGELLEGYIKIDLDDAGLMQDSETGFDSKLYYNSKTNEVVIAYGGSDMELSDWGTNIKQALGDGETQYDKLFNQVAAVRSYADRTGATVATTGNSLGGGLAIASAATGSVNSVVAFNPAGVHENTIDMLNGTNKSVAESIKDMNSITTTYVARGDLLTNFQDIFSFMVPTARGTQVVVEGGGIHFIDQMVQAFYGQE